MPRHILDTGILIELAQRDAFALLSGLAGDLPCFVPDEVDAELQRGKARHTDHFARYQQALSDRLLLVVGLELGSPEHQEFLRLRVSRTSPQRNRGEDACLALALTWVDSFVYLIDPRARNRATRLVPVQLRSLEDLPGWPPSAASS
jgi:predicted nucleic acid-binding protein